MELKNVAPLGFYALRRNWPRVLEMVWDTTRNWTYNKDQDSDRRIIVSVGFLA
jgi:hypothetical protein